MYTHRENLEKYNKAPTARRYSKIQERLASLPALCEMQEVSLVQ